MTAEQLRKIKNECTRIADSNQPGARPFEPDYLAVAVLADIAESLRELNSTLHEHLVSMQ